VSAIALIDYGAGNLHSVHNALKAAGAADVAVTADPELVREFFQAFAINAGITLHVETLYGDNAHHIAESCYKGLARALRQAVSIDPGEAGRVPSTKGSL